MKCFENYITPFIKVIITNHLLFITYHLTFNFNLYLINFISQKFLLILILYLSNQVLHLIFLIITGVLYSLIVYFLNVFLKFKFNFQSFFKGFHVLIKIMLNHHIFITNSDIFHLNFLNFLTFLNLLIVKFKFLILTQIFNSN